MSPVDNRISGRLALITGASGGYDEFLQHFTLVVPLEIVLTRPQYRRSSFSRPLGGRVFIGFDRRSKFQAVEKLVEELASKPTHENQKATAYQLDTGDSTALETLFQDIKKDHGQGGPDILVSNAGLRKALPPES